MKEKIMFFRKISSRMGWLFVMFNFRKINFYLSQIKDASIKFGLGELYSSWISHPNLSVPYSMVVVTAIDYSTRKGRNYQIILRKLFGGI